MKKDISKYVLIGSTVLIVLVFLSVLIYREIKPEPLGGALVPSYSYDEGSILENVTAGTAAAFHAGGTIIHNEPLILHSITIQNDAAGLGFILYNATESTHNGFKFFEVNSDSIGGDMERTWEFDTYLEGLNADVSPGLNALFIYTPK